MLFPVTRRAMGRASILVLLAAAAWQLSRPADAAVRDRAPNILVILADDLGYGDVSCYNPEAKVATTHLDRLAAQGMRFTDAHSPSTVCTPTRYSLLTGRMAFRNGMRGVFAGAGGPCLIEAERLTLPEMLRRQGYRTACIGKWHVGLTFSDEDGRPIHDSGRDAIPRIDYSRPIPDGPVHRGFDLFFGTACCPTTDWLYAFIEDDRIPRPPTRQLDKSALPTHPYSKDCRPGWIADDFSMERVDLQFLERSLRFLRQHVAERPDQPFFLYHCLQAVHLPSFAAPEYQGRSGAGPHGDFLLEMDDIVGRLAAELTELRVADNTIVVFTSDNGPEIASVVHMREDHRHDGARPWRGIKRDQWEGGHRVPLIVRWPERVAAASTCDQTVCLTDLMATFATVNNIALPDDAAEDSFNLLPLWEGSSEPVRDHVLHQTISLALAIRSGPWKYLDHRGSGGNNYDREPLRRYRLPEKQPDAPGQLYHLGDDPGETTNLYFEHPDVVARLQRQLREYRESGRSAPPR